MSKTPDPTFGGFSPEALGSTKPAQLSYDPAGGHPITRDLPQSSYSEPEMQKPRAGARDERAPFALEPRK
jgi:hypothetical protein